MRCKNCGWPNQPGEKNCVKCHAPLEAEAVTNNVAAAVQQPADGASARKTVLEPMAVGQDNRPRRTTCEQCGFPLREGASKCPKCGAPVRSSVVTPHRATVLTPSIQRPVERPIEKPVERPIEKPMAKPQEVSQPESKTINPYIDGFDIEPTCSLKPIKRAGETKKLDTLEFEGTELLLRRENTDPDNATISTEGQALITNEEGKWYIIDRSEVRTTFVRASEKTELKDGAIILLGNRLFEFHA